MVNTLTFDSNISQIITNIQGSSKIAFIYSKTAGINTAQKRFLGVHWPQKTMAINYGFLKLISYSYSRSHCSTKHGFYDIFFKKIDFELMMLPIMKWRIVVDFGKNAVVFSYVIVSSYLVFTKIAQLLRLLTKLFCNIVYVIEPISGWVNRTSATELINSGSIPGRVKAKTIKIAASLLDVQDWKGQCETFTVCGRQVAA